MFLDTKYWETSDRKYYAIRKGPVSYLAGPFLWTKKFSR